jgi:hypothetical protein
MTILNFPSPSAVGQRFLAQNGVAYEWDGEKWVAQGSTSYNAFSNNASGYLYNDGNGVLSWTTVSGSGYGNIDGGAATSVYTADLNIDGGGAY